MLSSEARKFLLDMRLFLTAKSVKESDIENFIEDAELHLIEGESDGKSVEDIFGSSPKEYANELVQVMEKDRQETWKQIGFTVNEYRIVLDYCFYLNSESWNVTDFTYSVYRL